MARISYVEEKDHPELAADIAKIKGARGGLLNIYKLLLHSPTIAVPDGVSLEECESLKDWRPSKFFNEAERATLAYVDAMIAGPEVPDDVFNAVRKHYTEREIVELTVLVGTYLMHNRVFTAL